MGGSLSIVKTFAGFTHRIEELSEDIKQVLIAGFNSTPETPIVEVCGKKKIPGIVLWEWPEERWDFKRYWLLGPEGLYCGRGKK